MAQESKIYLVGFTPEKCELIHQLLVNTEYDAANIKTALTIDELSSNNNLNKFDVIILLGNPTKYLSLEPYKSLENIYPVLFITEENFDESAVTYKITDLCDCIPENELTAFTLKKSLKNLTEKCEINNNLAEIDDARTQLCKNEEKLRDLFENSAVGMYEVDKDGNFILANQVFFKIMGITDYSDLEKLNAFQSGISTNGVRQKIRDLLEKEDKIVDLEDEWLKVDKTKITVKENIRVKKDENGNIQYYQGVVEDISNKKSIEAELVESKKNAEKSDKLKSEFLTQISHEIRTPVNNLLSFVALIEDELHDSLSEELMGCFEHVDKAGRRITRTIDLLIKMSELHTDNYEPEFKQNNLFELLEDLVAFYTPIAKEKGLELEYIKGVDSANIVFDKFTVYDIFSNLIDNAIKFTNEGSVKIYIKKSLINKISVTVLDSGIGISQNYLENIFKPFSQETTGYTRKFDGNGLGMSLVKEYCSLNKAEIFVSSEKNLGSNFTVMFK